LKRAGVRNAQVLQPGDTAALETLGPRFDVILVDAPCTGSGTWRRRPDSKWRLKPQDVLDRAAGMVKSGGRIVYVTCSVLPNENGEQVRSFISRHPEFSIQPLSETASGLWDKAEEFENAALRSPEGWLMTPRRTGTDGFFVSVLKKT
jgi:16S rRNA (cytosine967-C5)-methyltransferase